MDRLFYKYLFLKDLKKIWKNWTQKNWPNWQIRLVKM